MENEKVKKKVIIINNMEINKKERTLRVSINPKIYSLPVIYSALYSFLDKAYIYIDGDPGEEIIVTLIPKTSEEELETLGRELNNELINCAAFAVRMKNIKEIRNTVAKNIIEDNKNVKRNSL